MTTLEIRCFPHQEGDDLAKVFDILPSGLCTYYDVSVNGDFKCTLYKGTREEVELQDGEKFDDAKVGLTEIFVSDEDWTVPGLTKIVTTNDKLKIVVGDKIVLI